MLSRASSIALFVTALFNCSLIIGVEAPYPFLSCVSELQCKVGEFGAFPLAEEPLSFALPELPTGEHALLRHPSWGIKRPLLALPLAPPQPWECNSQPWCFSGLVFTRPSTQIQEVRSRDCSNHVHRLAEGAMEAAQIPAQPSSTACAYKTHNS